MAKKELETKLNEFVNNFKLNTPDLNNICVKKDIYKDKILNLVVKKVCETKEIGVNKIRKDKFLCIKPKDYDKLLIIIKDFVMENDDKTITKILKSEFIIIKEKRKKYYLHLFGQKNIINLLLVNTNCYLTSNHIISKLEQKYKPNLTIGMDFVNTLKSYEYNNYDIFKGRPMYYTKEQHYKFLGEIVDKLVEACPNLFY